MEIVRIVSQVFDENCYVVANEETKKALVIDPGARSAQRINKVIKELEVDLMAVVLTHGHPDHAWDTAEISEDYSSEPLPVYISEPDHYRIEKMLDLMVPELTPAFDPQKIGPWRKAKNLQLLPSQIFQDSGIQLVPGIALRGVPAPGHTQGSTIFLGQASCRDFRQNLGIENSDKFMFSGDVIFSGSVGRTDLPGGNSENMKETLRTLRQVIDPDTVILPGHGPSTTMKKEIKSNPFFPTN